MLLLVYIVEMSTMPGVWEVCCNDAFTSKDEASKYAQHLTDVALGKLTTRVKTLTVINKA